MLESEGMAQGWHTIITAAHCVYDPVTNTWNGPITVTPIRQGTNAPYGTHPLAHPVTGVGITIPSAFDNNTSGGNAQWDYAVVDLSSHTTSPVGWNGYIVNYTGTSAKLYGYPRGLNPGETNSQVKLCPGKTTAGWQCGMSGTGYVNDFRYESGNIDSSASQSGGAWLASTNHTIGVHTGWRTYVEFPRCGVVCSVNYGRRLDSTFWTAIQNWSTDY